jgi:hypothetical protein
MNFKELLTELIMILLPFIIGSLIVFITAGAISGDELFHSSGFWTITGIWWLLIVIVWFTNDD